MCTKHRVAFIFSLALLLSASPHPTYAVCVPVTTYLAPGVTHAEVIELKKFLVQQGLLTDVTYTSYFGSLTEAAVKEWQRRNGIESTGTVGPKTRAALSQCGASVVSSMQPPSSTNASTASCEITTTLSRGMKGTDVTRLQLFLMSQKLLSSDSATGFYGALTEAAVKQFQCKEMNLCTGTPQTTGYGMVGKLTRGKVGEVCRVRVAPTPTVPVGTSTLPVGTTTVTPTIVTSPPGGPVTPVPPVQPTCVPPAPEVRTTSCPQGYSGTITESRSSYCATGNATPSWGNWQETQRSCTVIPVSASNTIQPSFITPRTLPVVQSLGALTDFVISDVCVNDRDEPIAGDPAYCARHRDLRFGEFVPFARVNQAVGGANNMSVAFPVQAPDGSLLVMKYMDWGGNSYPPATFFDHDLTPRDSHDLYEANTAYTSIISTQDSDPTHPAFTAFWNTSCTHDDSWISFPNTLSKGSTGSGVFNMWGHIDTCPTSFPEGYTHWEWLPTPFTYDGGQTLDTIVSYHYGGNPISDPTTTMMEQFYFTREYGQTRWEAWTTTGATETWTNCSGPRTRTVGGKEWTRALCLDWSFARIPEKPVNPLTNYMGRELVLSKNLLQTGDFAGGSTAPWVLGGGALLSTHRGTDDYSATVKCGAAGCNPTGSFTTISQVQGVSAWTGSRTVYFGGTVKADRAASITIVAHLISYEGAVLESVVHPVSLNAGEGWKPVGKSFVWDFTSRPVSQIKFEIYLGTTGASYQVDDLFVTPTR